MLRNIASITVIVALILGFLWFWEPSSHSPTTELTTTLNYPQAIMSNMATTEYREDGSINYQLHVKRAEQFQRINPKNNRPLPDNRGYTDLTTPELTLYGEKKPGETDEKAPSPWKIRADQGRAENSGDIVTLWGNVVATQSLPNGGEYRMVTSRMTLEPKLQLAKTDKPVIITSPEGKTSAIGMSADLKQQVIDLLANVQGTFDANPKSE
ncbi:LPS export ABC transporter periplasmic protein LptC [Marinibactrum halimedae]|uniref:Lipopolysaccharide export system protein LptC n=1 Tax=Marinibactrum halimedae TaxID=1444977 RepID=A0AA37T481_9GAMM|nr:LPS export ABC transporter periplasmic protein LptC [Marinibactrum halimedae]MCD9457527.1 LPS export ABC transporter periplasmic protein LptC [Marinibactrum halimedae]GLS25419.1 hypothetical protein GCM10007877_11330 [Marinibactrum halimedae]